VPTLSQGPFQLLLPAGRGPVPFGPIQKSLMSCVRRASALARGCLERGALSVVCTQVPV
jgi:hypothetical protein